MAFTPRVVNGKIPLIFLGFAGYGSSGYSAGDIAFFSPDDEYVQAWLDAGIALHPGSLPLTELELLLPANRNKLDDGTKLLIYGPDGPPVA